MPSLTRMLITFAVLSAVIGLVEWMAYRSVARTWGDAAFWPFLRKLWIGQIAVINVLFLINSLTWRQWRLHYPELFTFLAALFIVTVIPKVILSTFQLVEDIRWALTRGVQQVTHSVRPIPRATFLSYLGQGTAALAFGSFLYGVTWGKYAYRVERHRLGIKGLGQGLRGLRVVQLSDAHLGSFNGTPEPVLEALRKVQALEPDVILFTGDLVNLLAEEAEPWIEAFAALHAPLGKFSIMGNHDYADYGDMSQDEREANVKRLHGIHEQMGFRLLLNEHVVLERGGDELALIGVENWGVGFRQSGNLEAALAGARAEERPAILMSHDPTHWEQQVMGGKAPIELTLSGHTHGMQMGLEIPWLGVKFSPSKLRYRRWGGVYQEGAQLLHVNRGFGVLGFHGRVGMPPEITLLELEPAEATMALEGARRSGDSAAVV